MLVKNYQLLEQIYPQASVSYTTVSICLSLYNNPMQVYYSVPRDPGFLSVVPHQGLQYLHPCSRKEMKTQGRHTHYSKVLAQNGTHHFCFCSIELVTWPLPQASLFHIMTLDTGPNLGIKVSFPNSGFFLEEVII